MCNFSNKVITFFCLLFFLFKNSVLSEPAGEVFKVPSDKTEIQISLRNYSVSNPEGESIDLLYVLPPYNTYMITVKDRPVDTHFVVVQVHSYLLNVILALDFEASQTNSISGTNIGLLKISGKSDPSFFLIHNITAEEAHVMISVQAYSENAPIPGSCNMEFPVEISPFLLTTYDDVITEVSFAPSAPPSPVFTKLPFLPSSECNMKPSPVEHKMYYLYLPERDFTKETYFSALKSMMTKGRILKNGVQIPNKLTPSPMKKIFSTYPGTGRVYVVISSVGEYSSVYVPSFTYGCSELSTDNTCNVLTTVFSKVLCASILIMGLFTCFLGHIFFRMEIFFFGTLAIGIVTYVLVSLLFYETIALTTSVSLGVFVSAGMAIGLKCVALPIFSVLLTTLPLGFLVASSIFHIIEDHVDLFVVEGNYWGIFIGILATCPILMLCLAEKANIISCAVVGSYIGIASVDHYLGSNLRYIAINPIRTATTEKFKYAITAPPYQLNDIILSVTWFLLTLIGNAVQKNLMKYRPPFPPPESPFGRWKKLSKTYSVPSGERTPLVSNRRSGGYMPSSYYSNYYHGN